MIAVQRLPRDFITYLGGHCWPSGGCGALATVQKVSIQSDQAAFLCRGKACRGTAGPPHSQDGQHCPPGHEALLSQWCSCHHCKYLEGSQLLGRSLGTTALETIFFKQETELKSLESPSQLYKSVKWLVWFIFVPNSVSYSCMAFQSLAQHSTGLQKRSKDF